MLIDFLIDCHLPKRKSYIFVIVQYISFSVKDYFPTKIAFCCKQYFVLKDLLKKVTFFTVEQNIKLTPEIE